MVYFCLLIQNLISSLLSLNRLHYNQIKFGSVEKQHFKQDYINSTRIFYAQLHK